MGWGQFAQRVVTQGPAECDVGGWVAGGAEMDQEMEKLRKDYENSQQSLNEKIR